MTTDQTIREAKNRWARRRRRLIGYGQWEPFTDAAPVRRHVLAIQATGMGLARIAKHTGVNRGSLDHLLYGSHPFPPAVQIRTENAHALLAYWPSLDDYDDRAVIDSTGTRRRMQALATAGWPSTAIHRRIQVGNPQTIEKLRARTKVTARLARAIRDFYDEVSEHTAEDYGVTPTIANRTRNYAAKRQYTPAIAWDEDTIDDPAAHPEWTGYCGTDRGYWVHTLQKLTVCARCLEAHERWVADHAHLTRKDRAERLFAQRAIASTREAALAEDARELLRLDIPVDVAAARLGVTRNHLQQAMKRHPAQLDTAA